MLCPNAGDNETDVFTLNPNYPIDNPARTHPKFRENYQHKYHPHKIYRENSAQGIHRVRSLLYDIDGRKYAVSLGNIKLSGTIVTFNMPTAITCAGAGVCKQYCYARKWERRPAILESRKRNYAHSKKKTFISDIKEILSRIYRDYPWVIGVRIHEAGDFYDMNYTKKWVEIAQWMKKEYPGKILYFYTKSICFVKKVKWPDNTIIWYSLGGIWDDEIPNYGDLAYILPRGVDPVNVLDNGIFYCEGGHKVPDKEEWYVCGRDCNYCMIAKTNSDAAVGFPLH